MAEAQERRKADKKTKWESRVVLRNIQIYELIFSLTA